ncbi:hypothetical protein H6F88_03970 [Oculatella sp. FACHB-28]|uniref:hypothetical protein n=1 Tax=Oculatella sp. FACHB-28 TaxID=2692845 RepID=UPI001686D46E|nr:hypothetical protein [Oculatella sp. FACHB-28]MBD2055187.1 hypothetical protein [Oculatella sp. FACHB-28]
MVQAPPLPTDLNNFSFEQNPDLSFQLPDPEDDLIPEAEFLSQVETAWQVCDRFDLQTEIWRGRILRAVRDREKRGGDGRGSGFLNWLKDREISKTQAYSLIELANSADALLEEGYLEPEDVNQFSKRAFVETAQSSPEVQQMVGDAARKGDRITRREVRQLSDEWTAMTSDLIPEVVKEKAANSTIPTRYLAPLVREMEKLPEAHQVSLQAEVAGNPDVDTLKQVTAEARYLAKYLNAATNVQALDNEALDLESALEEALRVGCLSSTADLVNQASQLEQAIVKLYTTWKRLNTLSERVYLDSGASTPHLRSLLAHLSPLSGEVLEVQLGDPDGGSFSRTIRLKILPETDA